MEGGASSSCRGKIAAGQPSLLAWGKKLRKPQGIFTCRKLGIPGRTEYSFAPACDFAEWRIACDTALRRALHLLCSLYRRQ
jgi:hypothetical protein